MPVSLNQPTDPSETLLQYDPSDVSVSFLGVDIRGFAPGTFIEIEPNDTWVTYVGTTGAVARGRSRKDVCRAALTLLAQHASCLVLLAVAASDAEDWQNVGPLLVKDNAGNLLVQSTAAWIPKRPKVTRGATSDTVTFNFVLGDVLVLPGNLAVD